HADLSILLVGANDASTDYPALIRRVLASEPGTAPVSTTLRQVVDFSGRVDSFMNHAQFDAAASGVPRDALAARQRAVRLDDIALLMYTSGTTSRPKGCLLTHASISRHGPNVARSFFGLTEED